jgi:hypothetical protein
MPELLQHAKDFAAQLCLRPLLLLHKLARLTDSAVQLL